MEAAVNAVEHVICYHVIKTLIDVIPFSVNLLNISPRLDTIQDDFNKLRNKNDCKTSGLKFKLSHCEFHNLSE